MFVSKITISVVFLAIFCMVFGTDIEVTNITNVECEPTSNDALCYVAEPIVVMPNQSISFALSASQANNILEFSVSYNAKMQIIPRGIFETFHYLEQLKLQGVHLKTLHHSDFENAWNLHNLTLSDNKLERIPSSIFSRAVNLMELYLDGNEILHLENDAFNGLHQLYFLSLNRNRLITLKSFSFSGATHLTDLRLEYNEIDVLEPGVFDLPDLMFLYLGHNQLKAIPDDCFKNMQLIGLDLQSNPITHVGNSIYELKSLRTLILSNTDQITDFSITRMYEVNPLVNVQKKS
ncbi:leucine-rich repeat-containing G-protein coupled receptor 4-like [Contarinia nasturtii]|uniref:leucine-rich repeat-containing G-protein coupled receptor 4-like n=1 Tax=Contarinia nasturtii TaxID=265458 RepID=UPI0012D391B3|nr:leucine-rich repeat-containing G-protein coupled receptor 4-like [Contarinia nasturtii]